jgi:nitrilase
MSEGISASAAPAADDATLRAAVLQMVSGTALDANLQAADALLAEAARQRAALAVLPEYFCLLGARDGDKVALRERFGDRQAPIQAFLRDAARRHGLAVLAGSLPLEVDAGNDRQVFNSSLLVDAEGRLLARYDKIHLFAFRNAREAYDEARSIQAGSQPVRCELEGADGARWRLGLSICYDLRFPELYRALSPPTAPCDALAVPSAFTYTTGQKHWELLLRARAVENLSYVLAAAQGSGRGRAHANGRHTWGHSMIVDPWGEVLGCLPEGEGVVVADLSRARLAEVRAQLPALAHRRL